MKHVYVLLEEGSWDYEFTNNMAVYANFKDALKEFNKLVKQAKSDMKEWTDDISSEQDVTPGIAAYFSIYEDGDYTRLHNTITISKKEVL